MVPEVLPSVKVFGRRATQDISQLRSGWARAQEVVRPGGTPDFRRAVMTDPVLKPIPGTQCRTNFPCRFATAETWCDFPTHHHCHETFFLSPRKGEGEKPIVAAASPDRDLSQLAARGQSGCRASSPPGYLAPREIVRRLARLL